jgi:hypothetical protein
MDSIGDICRKVAKDKPETLNACNFYLQAVVSVIFKSGDTPPQMFGGTANDIVGRFSSAPFKLCEDGKDASAKAIAGKLVVGGLSNDSGSGHVFIVQARGLSAPGQLTPWLTKKGEHIKSRGGAPYIFNGSSNSKIPTPETSVDIVFSRDDEADVVYAWLDDPRVPSK